jgi:hypothetical protein
MGSLSRYTHYTLKGFEGEMKIWILIAAAFFGILNGYYKIIPHYECVQSRPFSIGNETLGLSGTVCENKRRIT